MQYVSVSTASSGNTTLVQAISDRRIRVVGGCLVAANSVTVQFKSGSDNLTGAMSMISGTPLSIPLGGNMIDPIAHFSTAHGQALILTLGGAVQVSGWLVYDVVS